MISCGTPGGGEGLLGETPFWGRFWDLKEFSAPQRELIVETRQVAKSHLTAFQRNGGGYGLIHADLGARECACRR